MEFVLVGNLKAPRAEIEEKIKNLGGKVVSDVHNGIAAVISTRNAVQTMNAQILEAKLYGIQVVSEDFLTECPVLDPIQLIIMTSICDWGQNVR